MSRTTLVLAALLLASCTKGTSGQGTTPGSAADKAVDDATDSNQPLTLSVVEGTVIGHDGQPLPLAHVRLLGLGPGLSDETRVSSDGAFSLSTPHAGLARVEVTGVDHAQLTMMVVLGKAPLKLDIRLGTYERETPLPTLTATVWTDDPSKSRPTQVTLAPRKDGTYAAEIKTEVERVWYQVSGFAGSRIVNGPRADAYEYDGGGDYRSIVLPSNGVVRLVVDPRQLVPGGRKKTVKLGDPQAPTARIGPVLALAETENERVAERLHASNPSSPQEAQAVVSGYDWRSVRSATLRALDDEKHPAVRRAILATYFDLGSYDPSKATKEDRTRAKELIGSLAADDVGWRLFSTAMVAAAELSDDPRDRERLELLLDKSLPPMLAGEVLFTRIIEASLNGDAQSLRNAYTRLRTKRFAKTPYFFVSKQYDPDRAIQAGQKFPAFEFAAIASGNPRASKTITNEDLTGKVVLVDLWATWCKPCVAEMDNLHAAYDKYRTKRKKRKGGRTFEILSVSVDKGTAEVSKFRKDRFPMPWMHGHLNFDDAGELFGIAGIPYAVLVDEQGTILATSPRVNGASLDALLDKVLAEPAPK
ncbi:MAG: redoxin domain-containing protein [Nannocystaceae bacterium]|nr:redoxin domain-containing protein [Nannocystaceae bacterium]